MCVQKKGKEGLRVGQKAKKIEKKRENKKIT
jgi:hypothetical protein